MIDSQRFDTVRLYGFNKILRSMAKYPSKYVLPCHIEHGWYTMDGANKADLRAQKKIMLVYNQRRKAVWEKESKTPCEIVGSLFVRYRRENRIEKEKTARGSIFYPVHSCSNTDANYEIESVCDELDNLALEYKPVVVSLYYYDIESKHHDVIYKKRGYDVVCAGKPDSSDFVERYYNILRNYKYAISNNVGTYTFYSVEMGIPFFLIGNEPRYQYKSIRGDLKGSYKLSDGENGSKAYALFSTGPVTSITNAQRVYVEQEMGVNDWLSNDELHTLLMGNKQTLISFCIKRFFHKFSNILKLFIG